MKYIDDYYPDLVQFLMDGGIELSRRVFIVNESGEAPCAGTSEDDPDRVPPLESFVRESGELNYIHKDSWFLFGALENPHNISLSGDGADLQDIIASFKEADRTCLMIPLLNQIYGGPCAWQQIGPLRTMLFWEPFNKLLSLMKENSKLLIPVPIRFLTAADSGILRLDLFSNHRALIIEHDHPYSGVRFGLDCNHERDTMATIVLWKNPGPMTFYKIQQEGAEDLKTVKIRLKVLLGDPQKTITGGFSLIGGLVSHYPTLQDSYDPEITRKKPQDYPKLSEFATIDQGEKLVAEEHGKKITCLTGDCVTDEQVVDITKALTIRSSVQGPWLKPADLCLRSQTDSMGNLLVAEVEQVREETTIDSSIILIRFKDGQTEERREFVLAFLRSPVAARFLFQDGRFADHDILAETLRELPIPTNAEVEAVFDEIHKAKEDFENWAAEAQDAINQLMVEEETSGIRERLLIAGKECRRRYSAAKQTHNLDHRIITQYPRPLSFVWSEYKASIRSNPDACFETMAKIRKAGETLVAFVALLAASHLRHLDGDAFTGWRLSKSIKNNKAKSGFDFGTWQSILDNALNGISKTKTIDHTIPGWIYLAKDKNWENAIKKLKDLRNADAHLRISPAELIDNVRDAKSHLEILFARVDFLMDFSLRVVDAVKWDSLSKTSKVEFREIHGASVYSISETLIVEGEQLESGSLYLVNRIGNQRWHLLRPFLIFAKCSQYKLDSVFHLDSVYGVTPKDLVLRSFEFNSTHSTSVHNDSFKKAGLYKDEP